VKRKEEEPLMLPSLAIRMPAQQQKNRPFQHKATDKIIEEENGRDPTLEKKRKCWKCGESNHIRAKCRAYNRRLEEEQEERDRKRRRYDDRDRREENKFRSTDNKDQRHDDRDRKKENRDRWDDNKYRNQRGFSYKSSTSNNANKYG
jgi:hypothetical protein